MYVTFLKGSGGFQKNLYVMLPLWALFIKTCILPFPSLLFCFSISSVLFSFLPFSSLSFSSPSFPPLLLPFLLFLLYLSLLFPSLLFPSLPSSYPSFLSYSTLPFSFLPFYLPVLNKLSLNILKKK